MIVKAPKGMMYVCRSLEKIWRAIDIPEGEEHLYELMPRNEALELEDQWKAKRRAEQDKADKDHP